jgi:hypothetical protein
MLNRKFTKQNHPMQFDIVVDTVLRNSMVYSFNCKVTKPELILIKSTTHHDFIVWNPYGYIDKEYRCLESDKLQKIGSNNVLTLTNESGDMTTVCIALPYALTAGDRIFAYVFGSELLNNPEYFTTKEKEELFGSYLVGSAGHYLSKPEESKATVNPEWKPESYLLKTTKGYIQVPTDVIKQDKLKEYLADKVAELSIEVYELTEAKSKLDKIEELFSIR